MEHIKNIYCIGRNYTDHVKELNNEMPDQPLIFSKPTHALAQAKNNLITLPGNQGAVHHEVEIVLEIDRDYEAGLDRKSTRLNSSHVAISYAVFCLKKKIKI